MTPWKCTNCTFEYRGYGKPNICPECGKEKWSPIVEKEVEAGKKENPLDIALKKLETYEEGCEPITLKELEDDKHDCC